MTVSQVIFILTLIITIAFFSYSVTKYIKLFKLTQKYSIKNWGKRFLILLKIAIGQTKIFRFPFAGLFHAIVFWGFIVILFSSIEMVIDGVTGSHKSLKFFGIFYDILMGFGDIFAYLIIIAVVVFSIRRISKAVKRFEGYEMKPINHFDAILALTLILLLMISLIGININEATIYNSNIYPISSPIAKYLDFCPCQCKLWYKIFWWSHIELIFLFANILPYSKHFHVFLSLPNVFLSRLEPLGKLNTLKSITQEVKTMLNLDVNYQPQNNISIKFGIKDAEDVTWKTYLDSLTCTQCGRCTYVCPASQSGRKLSPRKLIMDLRTRMYEKGLKLYKNRNYTDNKSYLYDYISLEEIWACTLCNACAQECPVNIYHPQIIIDLRRYLVMEEGKAKGGLQSMFSNIENNGAPWKYSPLDRINWINS